MDFNVFASDVQNEYHVTEREAKFFMETTDAVAECIEPAVAGNIIRSVYAAFNGVYAMSMDVPGLVETSSNLARIRTEKGKVTMLASHRSSVESAKYAVQATFAACFRLAGAKVEQSEGYPGWTPNPKSELLGIAVRAYKELFGMRTVPGFVSGSGHDINRPHTAWRPLPIGAPGAGHRPNGV